MITFPDKLGFAKIAPRIKGNISRIERVIK